MKTGYLKVKIGGRTALVHRLVLSAFSGPGAPGLEAAHGDGCRTNNVASNLRWATRKENLADRVIHGTDQSGERHPMAKITEAEVTEIRALRGTATMVAIGERFGIGRSQVCRIQNGQRWS